MFDHIDGIPATFACDGLVILGSDGCEYKTDGIHWHLYKSIQLEDVHIDDEWFVRKVVINYSPRLTPFNSPMRARNTKLIGHDKERSQDQDILKEYPVAPKKRGRPAKEKRCTRGLTAYNIFFKAKMGEVRKAMPGLSNNEYAKEIGKLWTEQKMLISKPA